MFDILNLGGIESFELTKRLFLSFEFSVSWAIPQVGSGNPWKGQRPSPNVSLLILEDL